MEKHKNKRPKFHTKYDVSFYQGVVMKHFIKRNRTKVTTSNGYFKDQNVLSIYRYQWNLSNRGFMLQHHIPSFYTSDGNSKRGQASGKTTQTQKKSLSVPLKNTDDQPAVKEADPQVPTERSRCVSCLPDQGLYKP